MAILRVARLGHPILRDVSRALTRSELRGNEVQRLIDDMIETLGEYEGAGLAAPQVHMGLRLAIVEVPSGGEGDPGLPLTVIVNPEVTPLGEEKTLGWEGCLSIPDIRGEVPRLRRVRLSALDRSARPFVIEAEDFSARVIQHECDHLDGHVFLDRMPDMRRLAFQREFERHMLAQADDE